MSHILVLVPLVYNNRHYITLRFCRLCLTLRSSLHWFHMMCHTLLVWFLLNFTFILALVAHECVTHYFYGFCLTLRSSLHWLHLSHTEYYVTHPQIKWASQLGTVGSRCPLHQFVTRIAHWPCFFWHSCNTQMHQHKNNSGHHARTHKHIMPVWTCCPDVEIRNQLWLCLYIWVHNHL